MLIKKVVYPGRSLGILGDKTCFTDEGLPGEDVEVEVFKEKPGYVEARTVEIKKPSSQRLPPRCGHYRVCSAYQIMDPGLQLQIKRQQLLELMAAEVEHAEEIGFVPSPLPWNYRHRARFQVIISAGRARAAYHVPGSREKTVMIDRCHLVTESMNRLLDDTLAILSSTPSTPKEVEIRSSADGKEHLLVLHYRETLEPQAVDPLITGLISHHPLAGIVGISRRGRVEQESCLWGRGYIEDSIGSCRFQVGARSFFQINPSILPSVIERMETELRRIKARNLADIYCGLGTFGLSLALHCESVFGIESDPANIPFLKKNAELNGVRNLTVCEGPAGEWLPWVLERGIEAAVLDPPRRGLDPALIEGLTANPVPLILYLSCNPATLARDLRLLRRRYRPESVTGYDFFPQTPHIEALAVLQAV